MSDIAPIPPISELDAFEQATRKARGSLAEEFAKLSELGGFLFCCVCHRKQDLGDTAQHMSTGWPECCGYTMRWITQHELDVPAVLPEEIRRFL